MTNVTACGLECCSPSKTSACGYKVGNAKIGTLINGGDGPCSHIEWSANTKSEVAWKGWQVDQRTGPDCPSLGTTKQDSVRACQAACNADEACNVINYNQGAGGRCEMVSCAKPWAPPLFDFPGWMVYTFGAVKTGPVAGWAVGRWGSCKNDTYEEWATDNRSLAVQAHVDNVTAWHFQCDLVKHREMRQIRTHALTTLRTPSKQIEFQSQAPARKLRRQASPLWFPFLAR